MKEKEFRKLLDKYFEGTLSEEEQLPLKQFIDRLESENREEITYSEAYKNYTKNTIWKGIKENIGLPTSKKTRKQYWKYASVAVVLIGFVLIGYRYYQNTPSSQNIIIPKDAITLELEDGSIKVVEENSAIEILSSEGDIIGKQDGSQLVYSDKTPLKELAYNTLTVPYGKSFQLEMSDGTIVHLNSGSSVKYPIQFLKGMKRQVFVTGEAYLSVSEDKEHPFIVSANELNVRVLGTQFNVSAYPEDETTEVVLVEGSVSLYTDTEIYENGKNTVLEPGFKASFDKIGKSITEEAVTTGIYTSWRTGELVFRDMTFENILKKLERRYDISIVNNNKRLSSQKFQASFGDLPPIEMVLDELKEIYDIDYSINGKDILIE
ncbi:FecR family protein [Maribacter sp. 2304DJ31-5]|uniref:FecR family protein n=1 Tax=Maribacter sp. 2304DJ31-5 TaxID=3386273 RepID=UPI0039BD1F65